MINWNLYIVRNDKSAGAILSYSYHCLQLIRIPGFLISIWCCHLFVLVSFLKLDRWMLWTFYVLTCEAIWILKMKFRFILRIRAECKLVLGLMPVLVTRIRNCQVQICHSHFCNSFNSCYKETITNDFKEYRLPMRFRFRFSVFSSPERASER